MVAIAKSADRITTGGDGTNRNWHRQDLSRFSSLHDFSRTDLLALADLGVAGLIDMGGLASQETESQVRHIFDTLRPARALAEVGRILIEWRLEGSEHRGIDPNLDMNDCLRLITDALGCMEDAHRTNFALGDTGLVFLEQSLDRLIEIREIAPNLECQGILQTISRLLETFPEKDALTGKCKEKLRQIMPDFAI